jgi:short-subunit dehydrogenase
MNLPQRNGAAIGNNQLVDKLVTADHTSLRVLITGASGQLGGDIARQLAGHGVFLSLWGRDYSKLEVASARCRANGSDTALRTVDLANLDSALAALADEDSVAAFDIVLLVAGQGDTQLPGAMVEDPSQVARQCHINFTAPCAMAALIADRMCARKQGRIGIIGSAAAFHSLPFAPSYAGSKAGLARFADALRLAAKPHGVTITLAVPGFIAAPPGSAARPARPFEIPVETVAEAIIAAVLKGQAELIVPRRFAALRWLDTLLPRAVRDKLLSALPAP